MNAKEKLLARIIRVNQAGELGAQKIYTAQKKVFEFLGKYDDVKEISRMAEEEQEHLDYFNTNELLLEFFCIIIILMNSY